MKKVILLFLVLLGSGNLIIAQQPDVQVSQPYEVVDAMQKLYFKKGNEAMAVKMTRKLIIQKFNTEKPSFISVKELDYPENWQIEGDGVMEFNGRYYLTYSVWDKPNKKEQLFFREIDFEKGDYAGAAKLMCKVDGKISGSGSVFGMMAFGSFNKFKFQRGYKDGQLLVYYRHIPESKRDSKNYDVIGMNVFDKDLNSAWKTDVVMPYSEAQMENIDYSIDIDNNVYIASFVKNEEAESRQERKTVRVELLKVKANTAKAEIIPVKMEIDKKLIYMKSLAVFPSAGNIMTCSGSYSHEKFRNKTDGIFVFKVDKEGKQTSMNAYEIPLKIINQYESEGTQRKNARAEEDDEAEFANLRMRELVTHDDGSLTIVGEQYKEQCTRDSKGNTYCSYIYNHILVTRVDAQGNMLWMKKIPKKQEGKQGRGSMGFERLDTQDGYYFIFLDNDKNKNLTESSGEPARHADGHGGILTAYKVDDKTGNYKRISILDMKDVKGTEIYQFNTGRILQTSDDSFVFESYKKNKEDILIKVKFRK